MIGLFTIVVACLGTQPEPTAEELLNALRRKRPATHVIQPASALNQDASSSRELLFPEGFSVVEQTGSLTTDGQWWTFVSDTMDDIGPTKLLPNIHLETMVMTVGGTADTVRFKLSGEMTVFDNENYLLVYNAVRDRTRPAAGSQSPREAGSTSLPTTADVSGNADTANATSSGQEPTVPSDASVDQVIDSLRNLGPDELAPLPPPIAPTSPVERRAAAGPSVLADGSILVRRPGRLVKQKEGWTFAFESDHPDEPQPPIALLPNKSVELMIRTSEREKNGLVFLVTGDITLFEGRNYLLPRVAIRRIDLGNLSK